MVRMTCVGAAALVCVMIAASGDAYAVEAGKVLTWPGGGRGEVRFEGKEHAEKGLRCTDCHPGIFSMQYGTAKMNMAALDSGRFCGTCHDGYAAFGTRDPRECHECHKDRTRRHEKEDD